MPRYVLDILEPNGRTTSGEIASPDGEWWDTGHRFELDGRPLRVVLLEETHAPYDQKLICRPE
jgi:hypothetical protein